MTKLYLFLLLFILPVLSRGSPLPGKAANWHDDTIKRGLSVQVTNNSQKEITAYDPSITLKYTDGSTPSTPSQIQQAPPGQTKIDHNKLRKPSKHSAEPAKGEFQDNQIELAPDQERRQLRESRYKDAYPEIKDPADTNPGGPTEDYTYSFVDYAGKVDPFPASRSAAVVIGTVLGGKAFVSKDHTFVYSDFKVRVDQVLKQDPSANLTVGGLLVAMKQGGTIHFPSGHVRHFLNNGHGMPAIGAQYLFFLLKPDPVPEYETAIGAVYELRNGRVYALDDVSAEFDGVSEPEFLGKVQAAIAAQSARTGAKP